MNKHQAIVEFYDSVHIFHIGENVFRLSNFSFRVINNTAHSIHDKRNSPA